MNNTATTANRFAVGRTGRLHSAAADCSFTRGRDLSTITTTRDLAGELDGIFAATGTVSLTVDGHKLIGTCVRCLTGAAPVSTVGMALTVWPAPMPTWTAPVVTVDHASMTAKEVRSLARDAGVANWWKLTKSALIAAL